MVQNFQPLNRDYDPFIHVHAALATIWVAMLIVQPFLIVNKKTAWHRTVGKASYFVFVPAWIKIVHSGIYKNLFFSLGDCILLILFYSFSVFYRNITPRHVRFMIVATLVLLGPTLGKIGPVILSLDSIVTQTLQYAIIILILTGLMLMIKRNKKDYRPYILAIIGFSTHAIISYLLFL